MTKIVEYGIVIKTVKKIMGKEFFNHWIYKPPQDTPVEYVEIVGHDDVTSPLPEVKNFNCIINMLENISENVSPPAGRGVIDLALENVGLSKARTEYLKSMKFKNTSSVAVVAVQEGWEIEIAQDKRKLEFIVDTVTKKISGTIYAKDKNIWLKKESLKDSLLYLLPILMNLEVRVFVDGD